MNPLIRFGIRNIKNSRVRSLLAILAVILGVALITTLLILTDSLVSTVNNSFDPLDDIVIVQQKNSFDPSMSFIKENLADKILAENDTGGQLEGLYASALKEIWYVERSETGTFGVMSVVGIVPSLEIKTVGILDANNIVSGRTLNDNDKNATVIGRMVAVALGVTVGEYIDIAELSYEVVGIFSTGSIIDARAYVNINEARQFSLQYTEGSDARISTILIKPIDTVSSKIIKDYINTNYEIERIEARDFAEIAEQGLQYLEITTDFAFYIGVISVVIGSLSVFNAILMSVYERKREIAVLKATGWSDREVGFEVFLESMIISSIGGIIGLIIGFIISNIVTIRSNFLTLYVEPLTLMKSYTYAVVLGILAGLYPAYRAMKIDPIIDLAG